MSDRSESWKPLLVELRDLRARVATLEALLRNGSTVELVRETQCLRNVIEQQEAELEALHRASLLLTSSLDHKVVLDAVMVATLDILPDVQNAHIFLYQDDILTFGASLGRDGEKDAQFSQPRRDGLTYHVAQSGDMIIVDDTKRHPLFRNAPPEWDVSLVGLPLKIASRVVGVMNVAYKPPRDIRHDELRLLRLLADQAAIAIENARLYELMARQARSDALTDLPNRRALDEFLHEEVRRASRYGHSFALLMMDLDGFKLVNDRYGHPTGDEVLKQVAACLRSSIRVTDILARYGGDEFALLMPETGREEADIVVRKLAGTVEECKVSGVDIPFSISVGLALYPEDSSDPIRLFTIADQALYRAKKEASTSQSPSDAG